MPKGLRSELDALVTFRPDPAQPVADRRHPRRAERLYRDDHDRGAGAPGGAAGDGAERAASVPRSAAAQPRRDHHRRHHRRQQLRPAGRRRRRAVDRHGRRARHGWPHHAARRRADLPRRPHLPASRAATSRSPIAGTFIPSSTSPPKPTSAASGNVTMTLTGTLERPTIDLTSEEGSRTPGEIAAEIVGSTNTETALTLLSADLLGVTGRAIGLDAFRVERGDFTDRDFRDYQEDPTLIGNNQHRPDDPADGRQAAERPGRVHGVAEPARERQGDLHRQLLPAPQHRAARAVARQRHRQPRHPPPGDVRRRREQAALRAPRPAADQRDHG